MKLNIVLVEPEIPQNTGNIARTCAAIGAKLHLVKPLGFSISEKQVKRAGLDYWDKLDIEEHDSFKDFLEKYKPEENNMFFITTKGTHCYSDINYSGMEEVFVLFGKETKGLPEDTLKKYIEKTKVPEEILKRYTIYAKDFFSLKYYSKESGFMDAIELAFSFGFSKGYRAGKKRELDKT